MAEFAAVIGAIAAISGIAETTAHLAKTIHHIAKDMKYAREDIKRFADEVDVFSAVMKYSKRALESECPHPEKTSKVFRFLDEHKIVKIIKRQSRQINHRIQDMLAPLDLGKTLSWFCRFKWHFQKVQVYALGTEMNSVKASLNIVVSSTILYLQKQNGTLSTVTEERLLHILKVSKSELSASQHKLRESGQTNEYDFDLEELFVAQEAMMNLIKKAVRKRIASIPPSADTGRNSVSSAPSPRLEDSQQSSSAIAGSSTAGSQEINSSPPTTPPTGISSPGTISPSDQASPQQTVPPNTGETRDAHIERSNGNRQESNSYAGLARWHTFNDDIDNTDHRDIVRVYLNQQPITAVLNPELGWNMISQAQADHYGLFVQRLEGGNPVRINYGNGQREQSFGKTSLSLKIGRPFTVPERPSIILDCIVFRRGISNLVLGRPYLEARARVLRDETA